MRSRNPETIRPLAGWVQMANNPAESNVQRFAAMCWVCSSTSVQHGPCSGCRAEICKRRGDPALQTKCTRQITSRASGDAGVPRQRCRRRHHWSQDMYELNCGTRVEPGTESIFRQRISAYACGLPFLPMARRPDHSGANSWASTFSNGARLVGV